LLLVKSSALHGVCRGSRSQNHAIEVEPFWYLSPGPRKPLKAEDYVSKDIPPNGIIIKSVQAQMVKSNHNLSYQNLKKIIGEYKEEEDTYVYFLNIVVSEKSLFTGKPLDPRQQIESVRIRKLDTNT
jgi:hypothetical protein